MSAFSSFSTFSAARATRQVALSWGFASVGLCRSRPTGEPDHDPRPGSQGTASSLPPPTAVGSSVPGDGEPIRILVVGSCGAGKTTLARQIAGVLGVPVTSVDDLLFAENWSRVPPQEVRRKLQAVVVQDRWVIEGKPSRIWRDFVRLATWVVWLDFSRRVRFARLCRRIFHQIFHRERCCGGNQESLLSGAAFLWRGTRWHGRERNRTFDDVCGTRHIRICTSEEKERFVRWFENYVKTRK